MTHSSFANESPHLSPRDNERLEYLGDAVLQLITAEYLYKFRPDAREGEMTQVRSAMVNTNTLADLSEELGVGEYLYLGKGIAKGGGRSLKSLLANAFESILGAVFLDQGYDAAYHFYLGRFRALPEPVQDENHKGRLQQVVQERFGATPYYDSVASRGPGHMREYTAVVYAGPDPLGTGHGPTKQEAEQGAARDALEQLRSPAAGRPAAEARPPRRRQAASSARARPTAATAPPEPASAPVTVAAAGTAATVDAPAARPRALSRRPRSLPSVPAAAPAAAPGTAPDEPQPAAVEIGPAAPDQPQPAATVAKPAPPVGEATLERIGPD